MKFVNVAPHDLKFQIDGVKYEVTVGGSCEIPDRISYCIKTRGLPMLPEHEMPKPPDPPPAPVVEEMTDAELETATAPDEPTRPEVPSKRRK